MQNNIIFENVFLDIEFEDFISIVGPNGAGKSTLLKSIMKLIPIDSGQIKIFDKDIEQIRSDISYVPQKNSIDWDFPVSVFDVVMMGRYGKMKFFQKVSKKDKEVVMDCLEKVEMTNFFKKQISELSGGQQQRVIIARCLAQEAKFYLMDEPFVGIDIKTENLIMQIIKNLSKEKKTIMIVHHDLQSIEKYFDWIVLLNSYLVSSDSVKNILEKKMLEKAYGGNLEIFSKVKNIISEREISLKDPYHIS